MEVGQIDKRMKRFADYIKMRELYEPAAPMVEPSVPSQAKRGVARAINTMPSDSAVDAISAATTGNMKQNPQAMKSLVSKSLAKPAVKSLGDVTSVLGMNKPKV